MNKCDFCDEGSPEICMQTLWNTYRRVACLKATSRMEEFVKNLATDNPKITIKLG